MKPYEQDDPMGLVGVALPEGDLELMAECFVEEYVLQGWPDERLMLLFTRPFFAGTHRIYREKGEEYVQALIRKVRDKWSQGWVNGGEHYA